MAVSAPSTKRAPGPDPVAARAPTRSAPEQVRLPAPATPGGAIDLRSGEDRRARRRFALTLTLIVLLGAALRAVVLPAGLPYQAYVDEGHVIQRADHLVAGPTWDPEWYRYPSFVPAVIGVTTGVVSIADADVRRTSEAADLSPYYDVLNPDTLLIGRLLVLAASVGTIVVTALLATRIAGRVVGLTAAVLVAAVPALVTRSAIVIVDTPATFFVMATMLASAHVLTGRRRGLAAALAGACAGLAFTSKYTAAGALLVVLVAAASAPQVRWWRRLGLGVVAVLSAVVAAVVSMPALVLRYGDVRLQIDRQADIYAAKSTPVGYGRAATGVDEIGWVLVGLGIVGLVLMVRRARTRLIVAGWLLFASTVLAVALRSTYQPFRNLLPLVPFVALAAAFALVEGCRWACRRADRRWGSIRWLSIRWLAPVVATVLALVMVTTGLGPTYVARGSIVDSRTRAVDWLVDHVADGKRVLVAEELAFAPPELARIPGDVTVLPTVAPAEVADVGSYDVLVVGAWNQAEGELAPSVADRWVIASFGKKEVRPTLGAWRGNDERIDIGVPVPAG